MASSPIFIVGPPRTGTTLTAQILSRHSAIHVSPVELFFFQRLYEQRGAPGTLDGSEDATEGLLQALQKIAYKKRRNRVYWQSLDRIFADPGFLAALRRARSYGEVLSCFMSAQADQAGKRRWGNQVPADLFALDHIFGFFQAPRIVVCVRHPLDYLVSCRDRSARAARRNKPAKARLNEAHDDPVITSLQWNICIRQARKALRTWGGSIFINRYEDLVRTPEAQVSRLCAFLEEPFEPDMLRVERHNSSQDVTEGGIFTESVEQWRAKLSAEEILIGQTLCRRNMDFLGYERVASGARSLSFCRSLLASPGALARALRANQKAGAGFTPYSLKRLIY